MNSNFTPTPSMNETSASVGTQRLNILKDIAGIFLAFVMFGLGCAIEREKLRDTLKKPTALCIGLSCQIILMPTLAYGLISVSSMSHTEAVAFMLIGCCPGGMMSNVLTLIVRGDIILSLSMTSFSNLLSIATIPAWIYLFTSLEKIDESLIIPYSAIGKSALAMVLPVILGGFCRWKFPKFAVIVLKITAFIGFFFGVGLLVVLAVVVDYQFVFPVTAAICSVFLSVIGMSTTYLITCLPQLKIEMPSRKAIVIEVSVQQAPLANTILFLSFGENSDIAGRILLVPACYNISQFALNIFLAAGYRIWYHRKSRLLRHKEEDLKKTDKRNESNKDEEILTGSERSERSALYDKQLGSENVMM